LDDGKAGAGFAIMNGTRWHGPVPGKQTVFRGELAALTKSVEESKQDEVLTVLVDAQAVLDVVRNCIRRLEPMDPTFHDDRDLITALMVALASRPAQTFLCKCKSHRGDPLNDAADAEAKAGAASADEAVDDHTNKLHFQFSIKGLEGQQACTRMTSRLQARMASLSKRFKPTDTFASEYLCAQDMGREFLKSQLTKAQPSQRVRLTLQMIGGNLPVQANLFKWGKAPSPRCLLCQADREGFTHVQCWCPALKEVRIQVHHSIWTKLLALLREHAHKYLFCR
jgi:ribonuclease HI